MRSAVGQGFWALGQHFLAKPSGDHCHQPLARVFIDLDPSADTSEDLKVTHPSQVNLALPLALALLGLRAPGPLRSCEPFAFGAPQ